MARDWKTIYEGTPDASTHTVDFPSPAIAGHTLVAIAAAPASIALPAGWTEHENPIGELGLSGASKAAAGGETSLTWDRDSGQSTAPRVLAGWVESRDDLDGLHNSQGSLITAAGDGTVAITVNTSVDGCRLYVGVSEAYPDAGPWTPVWPSPLTAEDTFNVNSPDFEDIRLGVGSGILTTAGSYPLTIGGFVAGQQYQVIALAFVPEGGGTPAPAAETAVEAENRLAGTAKATWDITGAGDASIQGFATSMSVARGGTLSLKVHSPSSAWTGRVYRLGYYGGLGARDLGGVSGAQTTQPSGTTDGVTGMVSCANWSVNGSWNVPSDAPAGVYVIKVARTDNSAASHIGPFVVTDPARKASIAVKLSDSTWQAYNHAGADPALPFTGKNLYGDGTAASFAFNQSTRCRAVSYERPFVTRLHLPQTFIWNAEYPLIRWLERMGYDVDYLTCAQVDADPALLFGRDAVVSSGHDEYWSAGMHDAFTAARDHATTPSHLLIMSGNEAFWRIRWDGSRRSYACWKDTHDGALNSSGLYSGTWQDTRGFNTDRRPPALLTGQRFRLNGLNALPLSVPAAYAASPLWRSTAVAALTTGQTWTSPAGPVGFEADEPADTSATERPAGLIRLSHTTADATASLSDDDGAVYTGSGQYMHALSAYRSPASGALVFGAGTCQYAWALDDVHDRYPGSSAVTPVLQQALTNLLADLGATPPAYPFPGGLTMPTPVALSTYGLPDPTEPTPGGDSTDIVTVEEVKKQLNIPLGDTSQDAELGDFIASVTDVIEHIVGPVVPREVVEFHDGGQGALTLRRPPVLSVTSVVESGVTLDAAGYASSLASGLLRRSSGRWAGGYGSVGVTYQAGRATTPASIKQAAKELVALNFRPQQGGNFSPFDSGGDSAPGGDMILGFFVPNRVMQMLSPHALPDGFA
ncbi:N,N-dimethylformamidase beta subunit family domain-containing protein [Micromonospora taraxaci]|uniref:N,N-dimethylformamidase beta subunit family domain-containing protein n=1 Tax=Micromonospora taraxaci TaxID=1316803 RepID=UPI003C304BBA